MLNNLECVPQKTTEISITYIWTHKNHTDSIHWSETEHWTPEDETVGLETCS
jgi:hypothetical protein